LFVLQHIGVRLDSHVVIDPLAGERKHEDIYLLLPESHLPECARVTLLPTDQAQPSELTEFNSRSMLINVA